MASEALVLVGSQSTELELMAEVAPISGGLRSRVDLGGVLVDQLDLSGAIDRVRTFLRACRPHQIVTVNLDFVSIASRNLRFCMTLNEADLAVADGMPLVWLARLKGTPLAQRVAGVDLFTECCNVAAEEGRGVFLLGAAPGVAELAGVRLKERFPGLRIVGSYAPPRGALSPEEDDQIVHMIQAAAPDFLFVALGAPRQDLWIRDHLDRLDVSVAMGVGCVFDLYAGTVSRAPAWMQRTGLEWAFRLVQEPGRLWRRYLLNDLPLFGRLLFNMRDAEPTPGLSLPT